MTDRHLPLPADHAEHRPLRPCGSRRGRGRHADPEDGAVLVAGARRPSACRRRRLSTLLTLRLIFRPEWLESRTPSAAALCSCAAAAPSSALRRRYLQPARAAQPAHGRGPARRRTGADGRHRRPPPRLQRRHDELRARADDGEARRSRLGLRRRRLSRSPSTAAQPPLRSRWRASGLERAPAHVLRRLLAQAGGRDLAERRRYAEKQRELTYKVVRPSTVTATLVAPGGAIAFTETLLQQPGTYPVVFPRITEPAAARAAGEGRWRLEVTATDDLAARRRRRRCSR